MVNLTKRRIIIRVIRIKEGVQGVNSVLVVNYGKHVVYCVNIADSTSIAGKQMREKTKEMDIVRYLKLNLPDNDFYHNKSVGTECTKNDRENTNGHLFPDIRFDCGRFQLIVEIDEFKHRGADYKCDERRMYDIIAKLGMRCVFIRYNPDAKESKRLILLDK